MYCFIILYIIYLLRCIDTALTNEHSCVFHTTYYLTSSMNIMIAIYDFFRITRVVFYYMLFSRMASRITELSSCDTFVALPPATLGNRIIFGKNSDRPSDEVQEIVYFHAENHDPGEKVEVSAHQTILGYFLHKAERVKLGNIFASNIK